MKVKIVVTSIVSLLAIAVYANREAPVIPNVPAYESGVYRNIFSEAGYSETAINNRLEELWDTYFYGDSATEALYYEVGDEAYILDVNNGDVRSEGMSYAMMICVQLDKQKEFNKLWRWVRNRMYNEGGLTDGYISWQILPDGTNKSKHAAPDGDEYVIMALMFASARWGDGEGIMDYWQQANYMLESGTGKSYLINSSITNMYNETEKQVVFVPYASSAKHTDPSYHLPAFYTLWSKWANNKRYFWEAMANKSREMFPLFANEETGLMPDYANFDGTPTGSNHADFRYDAWRCMMNMAMDYNWFQESETEVELINRIHKFFYSEGIGQYGAEYSLAGKKLNTDYSPGLVACNASGALASTDPIAWEFVDDFFNTSLPTGRYRYYDGILYFLNYLHLSGNFRIYTPERVLETALDERYTFDEDYIIVEDYSTDTIGTPLLIRRTEGSAGSTTAVADPLSEDNIVANVTPGNYDEQFFLEFKLPDTLQVSRDYSQLEFDIYYNPDGDNQKQDLKIWFDAVTSTPYYTTSTGEKTNHGKWEHIVVPINDTQVIGNVFKLYISVRTRRADFCLDNIKFLKKETDTSVNSVKEVPQFRIENGDIILDDTADHIEIINISGKRIAECYNSNKIGLPFGSNSLYIIRITNSKKSVCCKLVTR